jgi:hypothetical protein
MSDTVPVPFSSHEEPQPPRYASFILRCWTGDTGSMHARLIDVHSGVARPVSDLADLPALVRTLVAAAVSPGAPTVRSIEPGPEIAGDTDQESTRDRGS